MPPPLMPLSPGTYLNQYQITSLLGAGGMGEVYLAHDTKLDRKVALKILPADLASQTDRMRRFILEAKSAAALNHPHVAHIYEIGQDSGSYFIALEYIDGTTLREKIHQGKTPLVKLLKYLSQVADGLAKSHSVGIVHRDLKPDNIMITREDYAKILDFGLAKLVEPQGLATVTRDGSLLPTLVITQNSLPGTVMGSAGYMSPEQAQGRVDEIDHRSDIFSFGCILFEAVTARKAFDGHDALDSIHKIVYGPTPEIKDSNPEAPDELQRIVRRCLNKEPARRYQSIREVAIELEEVQEEIKRAADDRPASSSSDPRLTSSAEFIISGVKRHRSLAIGLVFFILAVVALSTYSIVNFSIPTSNGLSLASAKLNRLTNSGKAALAAISPDGRYVAHVMDEGGKQSLWIRQVATERDVKLLGPAEMEFWGLAFSPDGEYVVYTVHDQISLRGSVYQIPSLGGNTRRLIDGAQSRVTFSPEGKKLAFFRTVEGEDQLVIANADGSDENKLAGRRGNEQFFRNHAAPSWSPDGKTIACPVGNLAENYMSVVVVSVDSGAINFFTDQKWRSVTGVSWTADGNHIVFSAIEHAATLRQIWQVDYPSGKARRITNDLNNYGDISFDEKSDALVTVQGVGISNLWITASTHTTKPVQITKGNNQNLSFSWTPDGHIVYTGVNGAGRKDLYLIDGAGTSLKQLTDGPGSSYDPSVSSDGQYIFYAYEYRDAPHIWRIMFDGTAPKQLTDKFDFRPLASRDANTIFYQSFANKAMIWKATFDGKDVVQLTDRSATDLAVSPDGSHVACYSHDASTDVFKLTILSADTGQVIKVFDTQMQVRKSGRSEGTLRWSPDGNAIEYAVTENGISNIWSQSLDGSPPKRLTKFDSDQIFYFDYSRDGKQLALARGSWNTDVVLISGFIQR